MPMYIVIMLLNSAVQCEIQCAIVVRFKSLVDIMVICVYIRHSPAVANNWRRLPGASLGSSEMAAVRMITLVTPPPPQHQQQILHLFLIVNPEKVQKEIFSCGCLQ